MIFLYIDPGNGYSFLNLGALIIAFLSGLLGIVIIFMKRVWLFLKRHKLWVVFGILLILSGLYWVTHMTKMLSRVNKRVVVLGIDALNPEIIEPMMLSGKLPNFSRLARMGSYSRLATTNPAQSPVAWAGFATGKNPGKNGVFDFITRNPKDYQLDLVFARNKFGKPVSPLRAKGFWDYTSSHGVNTVVLGCPDTFPPAKIKGKMLSGMGVPDILGTQGTFTYYTSLPVESADVGGRVFQVDKKDLIVMSFVGPRVAGMSGSRNVLKSFKFMRLDSQRAAIEFDGLSVPLKCGEWSGWIEVEFDLGGFNKVAGICRVYLDALEPELKLYVTPINFHPKRPLYPISFPADYASRLSDKVGLFYTQGMPNDVWGLNEGRLSEQVFLSQVEDIWQQRRRIFDLELGQFKKGVLFAYFEQIDIIQHMFWRNRSSADIAASYSSEIEAWYQKMDDMLGEVLMRLDKEDTLLVLSDHGFADFNRAVHLNAWLKQQGYLVLKDPSRPEGRELFADVDWSKTRAYAVGFNGVYINRKGRESGGIVKPGKETGVLRAEIAKALTGFTDELTGSHVVNRVYYNEDIFQGKYADEAPDLVVGFAKGYRASWQTALGAVPDRLVDDNVKKWSGDHLFDPVLVPGVLFSSKKFNATPTIYDITPTLLKLAGFSQAELNKVDFDGKALY